MRAAGYNDWIEAMSTDPSPEVVRAAGFAAERLGMKVSAVPELREQIQKVGFEKTVLLVQKEKGDVTFGAELFARQGCIACHTVSPTEPPKGPFLGGVGTRNTREQLCESIMKPSAKITQGFETQWFRTRDGDEIDGFVVRETENEVELRNVAGIAIKINKKDVRKRGRRETSIMPDGLVAALSPYELASIISFLESLKAK
jgi:putative heme-binding domain-containing protein